MYKEDTIAAISTPHGAGGVGIIRISGDKAFEIAERIFRGKKDFKLIRSHTINYGKIVNPENGAVLDEVLLSKMEKTKNIYQGGRGGNKLPRRNGGTEKHTGAVHKRGSKTCRTRRIYKKGVFKRQD